jgi:Zinc dependent phospholipase C
MPSRYIHLDVAKRALSALAENAGATAVIQAALGGASGPSAEELTRIAQDHPAYVALGAIGPDFFFPYPDFKPPAGMGIFAGLKAIDTYYEKMDEMFWKPEEDAGLETLETNSDELNDAATQNLSRERRRRKALAFHITKELGFGVVLVVIPEIIGLSISNTAQGYDEQGFAWSDMLHYRRTYEFAARMWREAGTNERFKAFALGWMTHLATDVTGHGFVNQKCGGPWRLHWQRHGLIESHMDGLVYSDEHSAEMTYQALNCSALHLWMSFDQKKRDEGAADDSMYNFFLLPPPPYDPSRTATAAKSRRDAWDPSEEADMPEDLAGFIIDTLKSVYGPEAASGDKGQWAAHPRILNDYDPPGHSAQGFPTVEGMLENYRTVRRHVKNQSTDYYYFLPPERPPLLPAPMIAPRPEPPSGFPDPPAPPMMDTTGFGPGGSPLDSIESSIASVMELGFGLYARVVYCEQVVAWALQVLEAWNPATVLENWRKRWFEYAFIDLPLYNAMMSLHWIYAMNGIAQPLPHEVNPGLTTLGVSVDLSSVVRAALDDPFGGLDRPGAMAGGSEPSGIDRQDPYPRDAVTDPAFKVDKTPQCGSDPTSPAASEFHAPWRYPTTAITSLRAIPTELPQTVAGPYRSGDDARILIGGSPGSADARAAFESAANEGDTIGHENHFLPLGLHLGDSIDYTAYVVAKLTRADPGTITNFNLDADRGYGYLCWDWVRSPDIQATPSAWATPVVSSSGIHTHHRIHPLPSQPPDPRAYHAPLSPGFGFCTSDIAEDNPVDWRTLPTEKQPRAHDPTADTAHQVPVCIRYLDLESKSETAACEDKKKKAMP